MKEKNKAIFPISSMARQAHRNATASTEGGAAQCGADAGAAGRENRHEEVVHLAHREREDRCAALNTFQDFSGTRQAVQHHHSVIGMYPPWPVHHRKVCSFPAISSHLRKVSALALSEKSGSDRTPCRRNMLKINAQQRNEVLLSLKKLLVSTR